MHTSPLDVPAVAQGTYGRPSPWRVPVRRYLDLGIVKSKALLAPAVPGPSVPPREGVMVEVLRYDEEGREGERESGLGMVVMVVVVVLA